MGNARGSALPRSGADQPLSRHSASPISGPPDCGDGSLAGDAASSGPELVASAARRKCSAAWCLQEFGPGANRTEINLKRKRLAPRDTGLRRWSWSLGSWSFEPWSFGRELWQWCGIEQHAGTSRTALWQAPIATFRRAPKRRDDGD